MTDPFVFQETNKAPPNSLTLPVPDLSWREPYDQHTIRRDPETELRCGNDEHWYKVSGTPFPYPSVTTILGLIDKSKALLGWHQRVTLRALQDNLLQILANPDRFRARADLPRLLDDLMRSAAREPDRLKDEAARRGSQIHAAIEQTLLGQPREAQPAAVQPGIAGALAFLEDGELTPLAAESSAWHPQEAYAGQVDCIARHEDGSLAVIDWKSGSRLYPAYRWQAAAYAYAVAELSGQPVNHAYVVKVLKTPPAAGAPLYEADTLKNIPGDYATFHAALELWRRLRPQQ